MPTDGYYRYPTIAGDAVVFVSEDDLWSVPATGGIARRLTSGVAEAMHPLLSPDGKLLAFCGKEEGPPEVYVMPAEGGVSRRLTFLGAGVCRPTAWSRDGRSILFTTNANQAQARRVTIFSIDASGGQPRDLGYGEAMSISFGRKGTAIGRHGADPARWKRYRGGTAGQIWVDAAGRGRFERVCPAKGNLSRPIWIGERIYFLSDHEGTGNLYSCKPDGKDLRRHTDHADFYARHPSTDGRRTVYSAGARLFLFDPRGDRSREIGIDFRSPRTQRARRFVPAGDHLHEADPHPREARIAAVVRGKPFTFANWDGAVVQHGAPQGVRYRLARWLYDGKRVAAVTDEGGEESVVVFTSDGTKPPRRLGRLDIGRAVDLAASPRDDRLVLANHRFELILVDLKRGTRRVLDRSAHGRIAGIAWSPDGRWIAYGIAEAPHRCVLRVVPAAGGKPRTVTRTVLQDAEPAFDPEGKYLYFLSYRVFDPVYDNLHFELGFPRGVRPYLLTLRKDLRPPFPPEPKTPPPGAAANGKPKGAPKKPGPVEIDFDGIEDRAAPFPVPEGRYTQIAGITGGALFLSFPVEGSLGEEREDPRADRGTLETFTFEEQNRATLAEGVGGFAVSADAKTVLYRAGSRLRAIPVGDKPPDKASGEKPSRKSGWIDLGRVRAEVDPAREWPQMFREAWRLMRDHFWVPDLSGVDWKAVLRRYLPLLERVATRSEFSDLVWEMQGEMGTSHCYESGGDYRSGPAWPVGKLAAEFAWDRRRRGYRVTRIVRGDSAEPKASSPLSGPGVRIREGDVIVAVNGQATRADRSIHELLVNLAGQDVQLTLAGDRNVQVKTLRGEESARYREWVDRNRLYVHRATKGKAGYVHIPDMGPRGFSEFHRQYLPEVDRGGLLIDVRCNGGGHVSQLLLEKLRRERIGYDVKRHGPPEPYPADSPGGPMVCLTDEQAGSDGDMFSHAFKMYGLGPLVGTRTWGGVVGIWPRHALVDGSVTTQPEFSFWFRDVGFGIENHGTDPDVTVDHAPHDDLAGRDVQLERATEILNDLLKKRPPGLPEFGPRPKLPLPRRLPGR